jgi:atypical dual specificity phosphatase
MVFPLTGLAPALWETLFAMAVRSLKPRRGKIPFSYSEIEKGLYLGSLPREDRHLLILKNLGVDTIVTLNQSWELTTKPSEIDGMGLDLKTIWLKTPDYAGPTQKSIRTGVQAIERSLDSRNSAYVHCNAGRGRSAIVVICFLMKKHGWSASDAFEFVKKKRPIANMRHSPVQRQWNSVLKFERQVMQGRASIEPHSYFARISRKNVNKVVPGAPEERDTTDACESRPASKNPVPEERGENWDPRVKHSNENSDASTEDQSSPKCTAPNSGGNNTAENVAAVPATRNASGADDALVGKAPSKRTGDTKTFKVPDSSDTQVTMPPPDTGNGGENEKVEKGESAKSTLADQSDGTKDKARESRHLRNQPEDGIAGQEQGNANANDANANASKGAGKQPWEPRPSPTKAKRKQQLPPLSVERRKVEPN